MLTPIGLATSGSKLRKMTTTPYESDSQSLILNHNRATSTDVLLEGELQVYGRTTPSATDCGFLFPFRVTGYQTTKSKSAERAWPTDRRIAAGFEHVAKCLIWRP